MRIYPPPVPGTRMILFSIIICALPLLVSFTPQEARVNQKKIERERAKIKKQAMKDYNQAVRRHNKMQSKSTKASMKKTKKESKRVTPLKH